MSKKAGTDCSGSLFFAVRRSSSGRGGRPGRNRTSCWKMNATPVPDPAVLSAGL